MTAARIASRATMLLPGALVVYFSFNRGGFFPEPPALVAVLLAVVLAGKLLPGSEDADRLRTGLTLLFAAYAAWVLASGAWSGAPERALTAVDYVLVYGLGFVLFATSVTSSRDVRWMMRGLALGAFTVCLFAFLSRAAPNIWAIPAALDTPRLSYPLTYWNALGALAAVGIVLCVGLTCDDGESRVLKALSALAIPVLAVTLLLTFSRGPILACAIGLIAYVLIGRPRSLITAAFAVGPTTAIAVVAAYRATSLTRVLDGSALQASQGHHVAFVVAVSALAGGLARFVLAGIDPALLRVGQNRRPVSKGLARGGWGAIAGLALVGALVVGAPRVATDQYHAFIKGNVLPNQSQVRDRLTNIGADGRITLWQLALKEFDSAPLAGTGAGTYPLAYATHRQDSTQVVNAHSLYFENLGEVGIVGFALLVCLLLGSLIAIARRIRRPERTLYAAVLATVLVWTIHAGADWDWQMPAVTLPAFVLVGCALGRRGPERSTGTLGRRHSVLAVVVLLTAVGPALLAVSQRRLDAGLAAFAHGDCPAATHEASGSLTPLGFRHAAHEILAYCDAARGDRSGAAAEMTSAVRDDPLNWEPAYGLAVILAATGHDPRPAARAARALNRHEPLVNILEAKFHKDRGRQWVTDAGIAPLPVAGQYGTAIIVLAARSH